jgi:hypothetical protein
MPSPSHEEVVRSYLEAHMRHDFDALRRLRADAWVEEWPQSGERVRGHDNDETIMRNWPGGLPTGEDARAVGSEDRWVMTPSFTYQRVVGSGDIWWADSIGHYPDGSTWFAIGMFEVRTGQIQRETWYFAPALEAPEWRSGWVERLASPTERFHGR